MHPCQKMKMQLQLCFTLVENNNCKSVTLASNQTSLQKYTLRLLWLEKNVSLLSFFPYSPLPFHWRRGHEKALWQINFSFHTHVRIMLSKLLSSDSPLVLKAIPSPRLSWLKISILILSLDWCGFEDLIPHDRYLGV